MNVCLFMISVSLLYKSYLMVGGLLWMDAWSILLLGIIVDMLIHGDSIQTVELMRLAAAESYVLFVIKFFAIHQNMGPAQWGNTSRQMLTSQSEMS